MIKFDKEEEIAAMRKLFRDDGYTPQDVTICDGAFMWTFYDGMATGTISILDIHNDRAHPLWQMFNVFRCGSISYTHHGDYVAIVTHIFDKPQARYVLVGLYSDVVYLYALSDIQQNIEDVAPRAFAWYDLKKAFKAFFAF